MQIIDIDVEGMSCGHCVQSVTKALRTVPGVTGVDVRVGHARVETEDATPRHLLVKAIESEGFAVVQR